MGKSEIMPSQTPGDILTEELKQKELLTREETASYMDMSLPMLYYYMSKDENLKSAKVKSSGHVAFKREIIDQWLDKRNAIEKIAVPLQIKTPTRSEKERLKQKKLLTIEEAACYIGLTEKSLYDLTKKDATFKAKSKLYGRIYFNREIIDQWLDERSKNDRKNKYIVTKLSTEEHFIVEAKSHTHARRKACKSDGTGEIGIGDYRAKKIKKTFSQIK